MQIKLTERNPQMKRYCIISHTHWDREWYLPLENFRMRLIDLIDHLLDILETEPKYRFHLDAQTIVLEDYLEIRPHKKELLRKHISEGRILVGPWYVQNDFHLTSGEATVRNLIIGSQIANSFGGCMKVGYAADQFGLISQLPQIISRFGLDCCVFGRGFDRHETQFYWQTEDGSKILCEHMRFWYNNAQRLSPDPEGALNLIRSRGQLCAEHSSTDNYLLMNGVDHLEAQEDLLEILDKIHPLLEPDEEAFQDTLPEYIERLKNDIREKGTELKTFTGEFRDNGADNVLTGTLASRIYLKQWNAYCQAALEKRFEPLYSELLILGLADFPLDYDRYMWKLLIQNHPHDSICGCSVDEVHSHMLDRFRRVEENFTDLISRGNIILMNHISREGLEHNQYLAVCVNPTQLAYSNFNAVIELAAEDDSGAFTLTDAAGKNVDFVIDHIEKGVQKRTLSPINLPGGISVNRYHVTICTYVPPFSHKALVITPSAGEFNETAAEAEDPSVLENEYLFVRINENGTADIIDKNSGAIYKNTLLLEDNIDLGNSYNYFENDGSAIITSCDCRASIVSLAENSIRSVRKISYNFDITRTDPFTHETLSASIPVDLTLTLDRYSKYLGVDLHLKNTMKTHRLRLRIPTGIMNDINYAGQPFDCIIRNKVSRYNNDLTHPMTDYVGIDGYGHGLAILQSGIYEYEHMNDEEGTLALTLLRSTGSIASSYQAELSGDLEREWLVPGNQCLGEQSFRFAIYPYSNTHTEAGVAALAAQFMSLPYAAVYPVDYNKFTGGRPFVQGAGMPDLFFRPLEKAEISVPRDYSFMTVTQSIPNAMIFSAMKGAEDGEGIVLRFFNSTVHELDFTLGFQRALRAAYTVSLGEELIAPLETDESSLTLHAKPKEIVTVKVIF